MSVVNSERTKLEGLGDAARVLGLNVSATNRLMLGISLPRTFGLSSELYQLSQFRR